MKVALLIVSDESAWQALDEAQQSSAMVEIFAWFERWAAAGKVSDGGAELAGSRQARTVRAGVITDGPFIESTEVIGGVTFLDADSLDEAVEIASTWPGVAEGRTAVEVRPVIEH